MKVRPPFPGSPPFLNGKRIDEDCQDQEIWRAANRETKEYEKQWENWEIDVIDDEIVEVNQETGEVAEAKDKPAFTTLLEQTKPSWQKDSTIGSKSHNLDSAISSKGNNSQKTTEKGGRTGRKQRPLSEKQKRRAIYLIAEEVFGWKKNTIRQYMFEIKEEDPIKCFHLLLRKYSHKL